MAAELVLDAFAEAWDSQYPTISRQWRQQWEPLAGFFAYPEEIRKVLHHQCYRVAE